ncbi:uncharacterized protein LOC117136668 [Drosophila mauritiana]|uniref:Uncharacterized protein LOC117136668 n=1 Tax=Drosophila mauritiana TaxID=7226 RepID=A0A6P8JRY3_DROMA|nr:uncharacterized protein LOC117136668 [Drosophila mauritiana]
MWAWQFYALWFLRSRRSLGQEKSSLRAAIVQQRHRLDPKIRLWKPQSNLLVDAKALTFYAGRKRGKNRVDQSSGAPYPSSNRRREAAAAGPQPPINRDPGMCI